MYENLLPVGSVVLLKNGEKRVMICGRVITRAGEDTIYDYAACLYPEGIIGSDNLFFFNRDDIEVIFFIGFQDPEEFKFRSEILANLGDVEVKDGVIVPKES